MCVFVSQGRVRRIDCRGYRRECHYFKSRVFSQPGETRNLVLLEWESLRLNAVLGDLENLHGITSVDIALARAGHRVLHE